MNQASNNTSTFVVAPGYNEAPITGSTMEGLLQLNCTADIAALTEPPHQGKADVVPGSRFLRPADMKAVPSARRWLRRGGKASNWLMTEIRLRMCAMAGTP